MKDRTLVIVDMQRKFPFFTSAFATDSAIARSVIEENKRQINIAKRRGWAIVVVLFHDYGPIISELGELLEGYSRQATVTKRGNDGSTEVLQTCKDNTFPMDLFRVTGIYTEFCVASTIQGLHAIPCMIQMVKKACGACGNYAYDPYKNMTQVQYIPRQRVAA